MPGGLLHPPMDQTAGGEGWLWWPGSGQGPEDGDDLSILMEQNMV